MKYIASLFLICILCQGISGGRTQLDTSIYSFKITGTVVFKKHQSPPGATVYLMWNGPIMGRIPWAHVNKDGTFLLEFNRSACIMFAPILGKRKVSCHYHGRRKRRGKILSRWFAAKTFDWMGSIFNGTCS